MEIERGVDRFAEALREAATRPSRTVQVFDTLLFTLDDLQRQIDELKEEAR